MKLSTGDLEVLSKFLTGLSQLSNDLDAQAGPHDRFAIRLSSGNLITISSRLSESTGNIEYFMETD